MGLVSNVISSLDEEAGFIYLLGVTYVLSVYLRCSVIVTLTR